MKHIRLVFIRINNFILLGVINFTPFCVCAQTNLIINPSCEDAIQIPNNLAGYPYCKSWWEPYVLTTDYFTNQTSSTNNNCIPQNVFGYQFASDGNFYLGLAIIDWAYSTNDYISFREDYAAGRFSETLTKDQVYLFEFWVSKANKGFFVTNVLDLILTYDTIVDVNNYESYGYKIWSEATPMTDTVNWIKISTCFRAKGSEKAFAIGNFHEIEDVQKEFPLSPSPSGELDYRYLDNFSLIERPTCCPDQFPDEEQVYIYSNPSTESDPASIVIWLESETTGELEIYDSAGRLVVRRSYTDLQNTFTFEQMAAGMYHYHFMTSNGFEENGKVLVEN